MAHATRSGDLFTASVEPILHRMANPSDVGWVGRQKTSSTSSEGQSERSCTAKISTEATSDAITAHAPHTVGGAMALQL